MVQGTSTMDWTFRFEDRRLPTAADVGYSLPWSIDAFVRRWIRERRCHSWVVGEVGKHTAAQQSDV